MKLRTKDRIVKSIFKRGKMAQLERQVIGEDEWEPIEYLGTHVFIELASKFNDMTIVEVAESLDDGCELEYCEKLKIRRKK